MKPTKSATFGLTSKPKCLWDLIDHQEVVHLAPTVSAVRYSFPGIPSGAVDVIIDSEMNDWSDAAGQISRKAGKYDGAERWRLLFRRRPASWTGLEVAERIEFDILNTSTSTEIVVAAANYHVIWSAVVACDYTEVHLDMYPGVVRNTVYEHAKAYFPSEIAEDDQIISMVTERILPPRYLVDLRKLADLELFYAAKAAGWRKNPARVQKKLGIGLWSRRTN